MGAEITSGEVEGARTRPRIGIALPDEQAGALAAEIGAAGAPVFLGDTPEPARAANAGCDLLIVDAGGATGCTSAVREIAGAARVPIIAVVRGALAPGDIRAAIEAGAAEVLSLEGGAGARATIERALAHAARLESERRRASALADALERAKKECAEVYAASITDWVTGLYNKRFFDERLDEEENKAFRTGRSLALVLVDLDHFKSVNDTFGHDAGDKVLREVAGILRHCTRNYDIVCRYGGEEFGLILPATRAEHAVTVADRVRAEMKAHRFEATGGKQRLTASCGVADLPGPRVSTREELFRAADAALYRAKHGGRDKTIVADTQIGPGVPGDGDAAAVLSSAGVLERVERLRGAIRGLSEELTCATERAVRRLVAVLGEEGGERVFSCAETTAAYAAKIAAAMDLGAEQIDRIRRAGLLQELGMVPLASSLGHKRALDDGERELVRQHPALSVRIADEICCLREELPIILHHHERYDGSGYPRGLRGDRIPLGSRVLSVAMAFEAMTSPRPYRKPLSAEEAIAEIERLGGSWYDPHVVGGFKVAFGAPT